LHAQRSLQAQLQQLAAKACTAPPALAALLPKQAVLLSWASTPTEDDGLRFEATVECASDELVRPRALRAETSPPSSAMCNFSGRPLL
jgi:hypothetical protein